LTRPLQDTADGAPFTYSAPGQWTSIRRSVDFYTEGDLMWLEADGIIQRLSHGKKSIEDFARAFFGQADSGPKLVPYHRADIVAALQAVQPYDWEAFFTKRIDDIAPHPPDPFDQAGWHLTYTDEPTAAYRARLGQRHALDARYSLGFVGAANGTIVDVLQGSPAQRAGIGPGQKIVAVDGRATDNVQAALDDALKTSKGNTYPITLLLLGGGVYTTAVIDYHGGARYPRIVRVPGTPDLLTGIAAPR
jgi:predicted metalloprotease with PDZ domain